MARARNIKPGIFKNELLGVADPLLTVLFTGLWCLADKRGRLEDRPLRIKAEIFPYREIAPPVFNGYLTDLARLWFISRYVVDSIPIIQVISFEKHQHPHHTEKESDLPENPNKSIGCHLTVKPPLADGELTDTLRLIPDSLNIDSLIPDSLKGGRFAPPSVSECIAEFGNEHEGRKFHAFYESKDWMVGKSKMKKWKSAVVGWKERNGKSITPVNTEQQFIDQHTARDWAEDLT